MNKWTKLITIPLVAAAVYGTAQGCAGCKNDAPRTQNAPEAVEQSRRVPQGIAPREGEGLWLMDEQAPRGLEKRTLDQYAMASIRDPQVLLQRVIEEKGRQMPDGGQALRSVDRFAIETTAYRTFCVPFGSNKVPERTSLLVDRLAEEYEQLAGTELTRKVVRSRSDFSRVAEVYLVEELKTESRSELHFFAGQSREGGISFEFSFPWFRHEFSEGGVVLGTDVNTQATLGAYESLMRKTLEPGSKILRDYLFEEKGYRGMAIAQEVEMAQEVVIAALYCEWAQQHGYGADIVMAESQRAVEDLRAMIATFGPAQLVDRFNSSPQTLYDLIPPNKRDEEDF